MKNVIILLEIRYAMLNDSYFIFKKSNKIAFIQQTHKKIWIYALILISYYHSVYIKISFFYRYKFVKLLMSNNKLSIFLRNNLTINILSKIYI